MGRRPDAIGGVKPFVCTWEGPEPTPPSRNGRVTADFQRSIHLLGFRVFGLTRFIFTVLCVFLNLEFALQVLVSAWDMTWNHT